MKRRILLAWTTATVLAVGAHDQAQAQASAQTPGAIKTLGVFSVLGDSVQTAWPEDKPGATRVEARGAESLDFKGIGFDTIALRASRAVLQRALPAAQLALFKAPTELSPAEQRALADGAARAELPAWMVKTLEENRLTHLLIITRHRGAINVSTGNQIDVGRGNVDGIGFYMDTLYKVHNTATGALSNGLLAPYTQIRFTLMDAASGDVLQTYEVRESFLYGSREQKPSAEPWTFMPAEEKVSVLRQMVEAGVQRGVQEVLKKK
jgi:hypothetical protein